MAVEYSSGYGSKRAVYLVGLMSILYALSLADRLILSLLVDPLSRDLGVTDAQMGLLIGTSFAAMYSLAGLPIAHLLDRSRRRTIVAVGVFLWSCSTIASGFAPSFPYLFACRAGVAIGEAVLTPAAVSLFADIFTPQRRAVAMSVYGAVGTFMGMAAFAIGAATLQLASDISPALGSMAPWRLTLILVGVPGALLGPIFLLTAKEPQRRVMQTDDPAKSGSGGDVVQYLRRHWRFFLPFYLGVGILSLYVQALMAWFPTLLVRNFALSATEAGYYFGFFTTPVAIAVTFCMPWFVIGAKKQVPLRVVLVYLCASLVSGPFMIFGFRSDSLIMVMTSVSITMFATVGTLGVLTAVLIHALAPGWLHARLMAIALLMMSLIGSGLGSLIVPVLAGLAGRPGSLDTGLSLLGLFVIPGTIISFALAYRTLKRSIK